MTIHTHSSGEALPAAATSPEAAGTLLSIPAPDVVPAPVPPAAGGKPVPSAFATRLARIAEEQHDRFHLMDEGDPQLCKQIKKYWTELGLHFESCVSVPWAPVFVSWCVKQAGATPAEFRFASAHSAFVRRAIQDQLKGTGVFRGRRITEYAPGVGDIIQANRAGGARLRLCEPERGVSVPYRHRRGGGQRRGGTLRPHDRRQRGGFHPAQGGAAEGGRAHPATAQQPVHLRDPEPQAVAAVAFVQPRGEGHGAA
jgi:hypothetical protein